MVPLSLLFLIVFLVWFWQISQRSRELAIATARQTCKQRGAQLLDGTAYLQHIRPCFSRTTGLGLKRTYTFDYSEDGIVRQSGCIIMFNTHVSAVLLDG